MGYSTLEDTLIGYIADELQFCSARNESTWVRGRNCPDECVTRNNPFWTAASINFAKRARGRAMVMLNATRARGGAVSNRSTFARYELPAALGIKELRVVLVGEPDEDESIRFESCNRPQTLQNVQAHLQQNNIRYVCHDDFVDALDTRIIGCIRKPFSEFCRLAFNNSISISFSLYSFIFSLHFVVVVVFNLVS